MLNPFSILQYYSINDKKKSVALSYTIGDFILFYFFAIWELEENPDIKLESLSIFIG